MYILQKINLLKAKNIFLLLLGLGLLYILFTSTVDNRFKEIELSTRLQIANQQIVLTAIAEITARNGADAITESVVRDCTISERVQFDDLIGRLDSGLVRNELVELERLFGRCGSFYSERKSVMVTRLAREIEIYENYVSQLSVIIEEDASASFPVKKWQALAAGEKKQSELFSKLVRLQDEIISTLLDGLAVSSPEITDILQEVQEAQGTLIVTNKQTSKIRSELIPL
jgi:hypothetical protein